MAGCRRAYGRSRLPRRYVPWSEKVFYLEQSKRKVQVEAEWHDGILLGIKDEPEIAVVRTPHGIVFLREAFAEFQKRIVEMVCCSTASEEPLGNCNLELKEES